MKRNVILFLMAVLFSSMTIAGCGSASVENKSETQKITASAEKDTEDSVKKRIR